MKNRTLHCSFCGKNQHEVRKLIAGPSVFICDECVELCNDIIREEIEDSESKSQGSLPIPAEINQNLDDYVIGQERAKESYLLRFIIITNASTIGLRRRTSS